MLEVALWGNGCTFLNGLPGRVRQVRWSTTMTKLCSSRGESVIPRTVPLPPDARSYRFRRFAFLLPLLLLLPLPSLGAPSQLLLLQYAAATTAGGSDVGGATASTSATRGKRQERSSTLFSSTSSSSSPPSPPPPSENSPEGLFLVGSKLNGSANGFDIGVGARGVGSTGGGVSGVSSLLVVPPRGSTEGGGSLGAAAGWVGGSSRGSWRGGGRQTTLGEKVVARALECLERLCGSEDCERYMTPLAREVRFAFS